MSNIRLIGAFLVLALAVFGGWYGGSVYPLPGPLTARISKEVQARLNAEAFAKRAAAAAKAGLVEWDSMADGEDQAVQAAEKAATPAVTSAVPTMTAQAPEAAAPPAKATVPTTTTPAAKGANPAAPAATGGKTTAVASVAAPSASNIAKPIPVGASGSIEGGLEPIVFRCPKMTVSNGPPVDATDQIINYTPFVDVQGVKIAVNPTLGSCLASGFGPRNGRPHKGVDYYSRTLVAPILAAGNGKIVEKTYRSDYGNMIVIDHGKGVVTRYAHLASFEPGIAIGSTVKLGQKMGMMGQTAGYKIPIHLHYEVLVGDYNNPKGSFGMTPQDVYAKQKQ